MMKQIFYFLLTTLLLSCSDTMLDEQQDFSDKMVEVSFDLGGDYCIDFESITRAGIETGDLVGIQVREEGKAYAAGLFNGVPTATVLLKADKTYSFECRIVKNGESKIYHDTSTGNDDLRFYEPFERNVLYNSTSYTPMPLLNRFDYGSFNGFRYLSTETYTLIPRKEVQRPTGIETYYGEVNDYHPMENGVVKLNLKCNKAPKVTLNFSSDVPDGSVNGTMKYYGYSNQTWPLSQNNTINFDRSIAPMAKIINGTWWGGVEQLDLSLTWNRGPEANSFVTIHKDVTLIKTLYLDNDKNYTINLHFRGQSDSDPEVWVGVDVDPDHSGDLDEENDNNE